MQRSRTAGCNLRIGFEEIRNLPKVNKGTGGADPFAILEIIDENDHVLIGGDKEILCNACKTKTIRKSLEGWVSENFEFKMNTQMVRSGVRLRVRVMDFKPAPQQPKGIGYTDYPIKNLAEKGGISEKIRCDLLALGDIVTTYGDKTSHGQPLPGHKDPTLSAYIVLILEMMPPPYAKVEGLLAACCSKCARLFLEARNIALLIDGHVCSLWKSSFRAGI
jgi:hypothetical protein